MKLDPCSVSTKYVENSHITFRSLMVFQLLGMNDGMYGLHRPRMQLRSQRKQLTSSPGLCLLTIFCLLSFFLSFLFPSFHSFLSSFFIVLLPSFHPQHFLLFFFWAYISPSHLVIAGYVTQLSRSIYCCYRQFGDIASN